MLLGSLLDAGVPRRVVRDAVGRLGVEGLRMRVSRVRRGALSALYVSFSGPERGTRERRWPSIRRLLGRADLPRPLRRRCQAVFERLARAEGKVHGIDPERVHFHEVGAIDALGDIVGACAAIAHLDPDRITAGSLPLGRGSVDTQHGRLPLPAPAALELLRGVPTHPLPVEWETVTPTGAALVAECVDAFDGMPALRPESVGYGAGNDRPGPLPNTLRAVVGRGSELGSDTVSVIETHLDDMTPEQLGFLMEELMAAGALDAACSPLQMKKGRPGQLLRVLAAPVDRERLARLTLTESTALGVRVQEVARWILPRELRRVRTRYGPIQVKLARDPGGRASLTPEYESCARVARREGVPLREVYAEAERCARKELS